MNQVQARKMVLVSAFLLAAITIYRDRKQGAGDTFKSLWGVGVLSLILSVIADFAPTIAGPFAALVVLGSLTNGGQNIINNALGKASTAAPATPARPAATGGAGTVTNPRGTPAGGPR